MDLDSQKVAGWLGLTQQQFDVLKCVHGLQVDGLQASPKVIQAEYRKRRGKHLQKPNLFTILRFLKEKGFVVKQGHGEYGVGFECVKTALLSREEEYRHTLVEFEQLSGEVEDYFRSLSSDYVKPLVKYLEYREGFNSIARKLGDASCLYATSKFPITAYPPELVNKLGIGEYGKAIWENCLEKKKLKISYLTDLDVDYVFKQALRAHETENQAYRTCVSTLNNLENQVESYDNVSIYYLEEPLGIDVLLPESRIVEDFYILLRDEKQLITGGVYIRSRPTAEAAKSQFIESCKRAVKIDSNNYKTMLEASKQKLKKDYGRYS